MKVKPVGGMSVIDPSNYNVLPEEGQEVPDNSFWQRRLRDGSVEVISSEVEASTKNNNKKDAA